ncbi:hypothetical protein LEAN103870_04860 [Legionella anisa]|uniref:Uncharacterized protein n=1 Tax=Legionella anisa TaxID=28082 RepID=A0AAX0WNX3_9GAMM|nr:hypothetical protein [Legionella anisa]AWN73105.1 hypothetical protein DLD14_04220 [Legionella anisa]KTC67461.1 hypothetical protein Lani_3806 [Legionella anisa]MBN5936469.1 hypothetical protein [Legionella anisa]MCW8423934.1 hypothetical protein [Legionella anisa]MCW8447456.1 hypothetical protein [Legionella anisa]
MFFKAEKKSPSLEIVQSFADVYYPTLKLHPKMLEQLSWLQNNSVNTSQSNVHLKQDFVNIEVKRILSRFYSFKLLMEGGSLAYATFAQSQTEDVVLSEDNFNRLSHFIQELTPDARECLMATCFITKSDQAIMAVPEEQRSKLPADSEQFITHTVTHFPKLFPICTLLTSEAVDLLPYAFYKNSHARQILDMEGGYNMVSNMAAAIRNGEITKEQYNLWFARWIINIAGLDGHINHKGSIYLTEPVANCIWALKLELDQLWLNPKHQVIDNYLAFREKQLEVNNKYIAYLGAIMRQYSPTKGLEIQTWFESLSQSEQQERIQVFKEQLEQTKVTPTFKPPVLVSLLQLGCLVPDALTIFTEIESQAAQIYTAAIANGRVSESTPLSYRNVAFKELLSPIKDFYNRNHCLPELTINSDGYLIVTAEALQEENTVKKVV